MSKKEVHYAEKLDRKPFFLKLCAVKDIGISKVCGIKEKSAFHFPKQLKDVNLTCISILWEDLGSTLMRQIVSWGVFHTEHEKKSILLISRKILDMVSVTWVQILLFQWWYSGITAIRPRSFACVLYEKVNHTYLINLFALMGEKYNLPYWVICVLL